MTYKPITLTDRFNIMHHFTDCQLALETDPKKIPHKICFNMSKQNQMKDFPQNSRKVKRVVIMNMGNSIAVDLYRFLIQ